jgi:hypothetical protein
LELNCARRSCHAAQVAAELSPAEERLSGIISGASRVVVRGQKGAVELGEIEE